MFTGLVEETGETLELSISSTGARLVLSAPLVSADARVGDSVAVNGCCLTVAHRADNVLAFDLLGETLELTNLRRLTRHTLVNLERALAADGRIGGHFVQGHIDCTAEVISFERSGADHRMEIALEPKFSRYLARKGSVAIDGISLTVTEVRNASFAVWIIPHTLEKTNLLTYQSGYLVNVEFDLLAKYVERIIAQR